MIHQNQGTPTDPLLGFTSSFTELAERRGVLTPIAEASATVPHGTTIVACRYADGVVVAGDRRATVGNVIALHDIEKVFGADEESVIGIAGAAGIAIELVRLFQVELEHFEKIEGLPLSFEGKANRLGVLVRNNLPMTMQGLAVQPLFAGWDTQANTGRIFTYDGTGGRYEERAFSGIGSGASYARSTLKKLHDPEADELTAVTVLLQSLFDAADDDSATSGLDLTRGILPIVMRASSSGVARLDAEGVYNVAECFVAQRSRRYGGPRGAAL